MGDSMATVLAKSLPDLPFVHSNNLTDNNLTGVGLQPLIHSMALLPSLTKINISQNTVNRDTAIALASYVAKVRSDVYTSIVLFNVAKLYWFDV